jgi:hypothetical protein
LDFSAMLGSSSYDDDDNSPLATVLSWSS